MTNVKPSQAYMRLLDYLHQDLEDVPDSVETLDRADVLSRANARAGKLRFRATKKAMISSEQISLAPLSQSVIAHARRILTVLATREPVLNAKFSLAFRSGKSLPDEEIEQILREMQALGIDLDELDRDLT